MADDYEVISSDYSDIFSEEKRVFGTPFTNATQLGGGVCSQGACFTATMILKDYTKYVHGPSESTALVQNGYRKNGLDVKGFELGEFSKYFRHSRVRLNCFCEIGQCSQCPAAAVAGKPVVNGHNAMLALRSYILSGIPVIAPVNTRLYNNHILKKNHVFCNEDAISLDSLHCMLIVGTGRHKHNAIQFVAQDPLLAEPWLKFSLDNLVQCSVSRNVENAQERNSTSFSDLILFPVLPCEVNVSLLPTLNLGSSAKASSGLMQHASGIQLNRSQAIRQFGDTISELPQFRSNANMTSDFLLLDLKKLRERQTEHILTDRFDLSSEDIDTLLRELPLNQTWVWIQKCENAILGPRCSLWIWCAETSLDPSSKDVSRNLIAVYEAGDNGNGTGIRRIWGTLDAHTCDTNREEVKPVQGGHVQQRFSNIKPSIVTSFLPGLRRSARTWNVHKWEKLANGSLGCEVYAFMMNDPSYLAALARASGAVLISSSRTQELHSWFQNILNHSSAVDCVAKSLTERLFSPGTRPIYSLASYIPEIANPKAQVRRQEAIGSLTCLCQLAMSLKNFGHLIRLIEIVAGTAVAGINWPEFVIRRQRSEKDADVYLPIEVLPEKVALDTVANSISHAVSPVKAMLESLEIALALEVEPGVFFNAGSLAAVKSLLKATDAMGLSNVVGMNVDVGHLRMDYHRSQNKARWLACLNSLRDRFVHCHISRHSTKGHFGDAPLTELDEVESLILASYDNEIKKRNMRDNSRRLPISSAVSIELEAAASAKQVEDSITYLCSIV